MIKWMLCTISLLFCTVATLNTAYAETAPQTTEVQQTAPKDKKNALEDWANNEIEQPPQETHFGELFIRMMVLLALTLLFLFAFAWVAKRFLNSRMLDTNRGGRIQVLEKRMLSPKACLYLVKVDEKQLVIGESGHEIRLIRDMSQHPDKI
jgi:flagellar biosynthetic protein FliO